MGLGRWEDQVTAAWLAGLVGDPPHSKEILPGHTGIVSASFVIHQGHGSRVSAFTLSTVPFGHGLRLPWPHPRMLLLMAPSSNSFSKAVTPMALVVSLSLLIEILRASSLCGHQAAVCHIQLVLCRGHGGSSRSRSPKANYRFTRHRADPQVPAEGNLLPTYKPFQLQTVFY